MLKFVAFISMLLLLEGSFSSKTYARQQDSTAAKIEQQLEEVLEETDSEESALNSEQLIQFLQDLAANPVNINNAGLSDLLQVPGFNLKIARRVLEYRKTKPYENEDELLNVSGIGKATFQRMQPYITVGSSTSRFRDMYLHPGYWLSGGKTDVLMRYQQDLQNRRGYQLSDSSGGYLGSPGKYYQRIKARSNHMSVNITQEKDAGETLTGITGFDFTSGHVAFTENGKLKELVIGDYSLSFGQGLVLWSGGAFGKGREVTGTAGKNERGVRPYSSAQETDFFRGVAATYGDQLELTAFYSNRPRTASVISGDTTRFPTTTGFHRTESEKSRKNNITQMVAGGRLRFDSRFGLIGFTGYYNQFGSYISWGSSLSNLYDFEGKEQAVLGIDYRGLIGNALIFGEAGRSRNGGIGMIGGIESPLGLNTEITLAYRNYSKDFQSFLGDGFGESSSDPQNEEGFYIGMRHNLNRILTFSGYVDQYIFPAPRFGTTQATAGFDILGLVEADFSSKVNAYILFRNEIKDDEYLSVNTRGTESLLLGKEKRISLRTHLEYQLNKKIRLRSRFEVVRNKEAGLQWEKGLLIYQDVRIQLAEKLRIDGRVALFDTQSFNTRIYQFESDLLYVLSNTALFNRGQRTYAVIKYKASDFLEFWLKYGLSHYEDTFIIGSGLNEIKGNRRNSLGMQARLRF